MSYDPVSGEMAADIQSLRRALRQVAQAHAWLAFGECRSFGAEVLLLSPSEADAVARVALGERRHGREETPVMQHYCQDGRMTSDRELLEAAAKEIENG